MADPSKVNFTVVGTLKSKGSTGFDNQDDIVLVPLETGYSKLFGTNATQNGEKVVNVIAVSASSADTAIQLIGTQASAPGWPAACH